MRSRRGPGGSQPYHSQAARGEPNRIRARACTLQGLLERITLLRPVLATCLSIGPLLRGYGATQGDEWNRALAVGSSVYPPLGEGDR